jgi:hypothetical protein
MRLDGAGWSWMEPVEVSVSATSDQRDGFGWIKSGKPLSKSARTQFRRKKRALFIPQAVK